MPLHRIIDLRLKVLLCCLAVSGSLSAQSESFFSEFVEVRVTNVDVIVTGPDGKPVTGLSRDDFRIFENGEEQQLSNFLEVRGSRVSGSLTPAQPAEEPAPSFDEDLRRRDIIVFVDNAALHPLRRN